MWRTIGYTLLGILVSILLAILLSLLPFEHDANTKPKKDIDVMSQYDPFE